MSAVPAPRNLAAGLLLGLTIGLGVGAPAVQAADRDQAVAQALAADGQRGQVLEVRRASSDGRAVWLVKVITDGRVRVHRIPADS